VHETRKGPVASETSKFVSDFAFLRHPINAHAIPALYLQHIPTNTHTHHSEREDKEG